MYARVQDSERVLKDNERLMSILGECDRSADEKQKEVERLTALHVVCNTTLEGTHTEIARLLGLNAEAEKRILGLRESEHLLGAEVEAAQKESLRLKELVMGLKERERELGAEVQDSQQENTRLKELAEREAATVQEGQKEIAKITATLGEREDELVRLRKLVGKFEVCFRVLACCIYTYILCTYHVYMMWLAGWMDGSRMHEYVSHTYSMLEVVDVCT